VVSGLEIARGLRQVSNGPAVEIRPSSWSEIARRFAEGDAIDVNGASGRLDYDPRTEETSAPISIWGISAQPSDGGYALVELERTVPAISGGQ
jgi:branched-chain amino acid transport system substrate-binding protein